MNWKGLLRAGLLAGGLCALTMAGVPAAAATAYPLVTVDVNGKELQTRGLLMNGRTLLPVRELTTRLGGEVKWDPHSKTAWASFPGENRTVRLTVNSPVATVYDYNPNDPHHTGAMLETIRLTQPPLLMGGRMIAPVAAAAEVAGAKVFWEPHDKHVIVQT